MTSHAITQTQNAQPAVFKVGFSLMSGIFSTMRERRALSRLDDHLLNDLGLSRGDVQEEINRAPWDAPRHWKR